MCFLFVADPLCRGDVLLSPDDTATERRGYILLVFKNVSSSSNESTWEALLLA